MICIYCMYIYKYYIYIYTYIYICHHITNNKYNWKPKQPSSLKLKVCLRHCRSSESSWTRLALKRRDNVRILKHSCKKAMDGFTLAIGLGWKSGRLSGETFSLNIAIEGLKKTLKVGNWKENPNFQTFSH